VSEMGEKRRCCPTAMTRNPRCGKRDLKGQHKRGGNRKKGKGWKPLGLLVYPGGERGSGESRESDDLKGKGGGNSWQSRYAQARRWC